ncbi:MAG: hypothetical protein J2P13_11255, partial [Acidobacteria bacterium]|nr:hypothetical protein [Acidobacteriota bacterium]
IFRVAAEIENIPLRKAHVFEKHPGRVHEALGNLAAKAGREIFDDLIEGGVSVTAVEQFNEVLAK